MQQIVVIGDKTSHGGTVITGSQTSDTHGKGWARVGDQVACPRCKGVFPISEGDSTLIDNGMAVAFHGCKVACGATLIAGQMFTLTQAGSTGGAANGHGANDYTRDGVGAIGSGMAAAYEEESIGNAGQRFRGRFRLLDAITGEPVGGQAAWVHSTDGQSHSATTDLDGFTHWVERDASEALSFDLELKDGT